jgi:hypothetical protein
VTCDTVDVQKEEKINKNKRKQHGIKIMQMTRDSEKIILIDAIAKKTTGALFYRREKAGSHHGICIHSISLHYQRIAST